MIFQATVGVTKSNRRCLNLALTARAAPSPLGRRIDARPQRSPRHRRSVGACPNQLPPTMGLKRSPGRVPGLQGHEETSRAGPRRTHDIQTRESRNQKGIETRGYNL